MQHTEHLDNLSSEAKEYIENRIELLRLEALDQSSNLFANITAYLIMGLILLLFLISFGFFIGIWLGDLLHSNWAGFGIVAGFYFLSFIVLLWNFNSWLTRPIQDFLIRKIEEYRAEEN